jgi:Putative Na+/H+ antiporter
MSASPEPIELLATVLFTLAVLHTFCVKQFAQWAHRYPSGSLAENVLHFLAETEVVFGLWAAALFLGIAALKGSVQTAIDYINSLDFTEPKFVFVIMVVAATRPVVRLAETLISLVARLLPMQESVAFYLAALSLGPLLGSLITEPAAMTLLAILLKRRYFDRAISQRLAYATLGLLFVNVSIGGTLTNFAAPPVLMVASKWKWDVVYMLTHFGWKAAASCVCSTVLVCVVFRRELNALEYQPVRNALIPPWLTGLHLVFLALVVSFAHHADVFFGVFMIFLGLTTATREYQDGLKFREGLLVGFFLAGLVTLGSLQAYWLKPLIQSMGGSALYFGATGLTAITDNAALTYLGSLVEGISEDLKYALVAGAVTGGGLTVIANAPNPAGAGILQSSKVFGTEGISPIGLFLGALFPTVVAIFFFWFFHSVPI